MSDWSWKLNIDNVAVSPEHEGDGAEFVFHQGGVSKYIIEHEPFFHIRYKSGLRTK